MLSCSIWFSAPSLWMGGGPESRCVGRVYGADGAVQKKSLYIYVHEFLCASRKKVAKYFFTGERF